MPEYFETLVAGCSFCCRVDWQIPAGAAFGVCGHCARGVLSTEIENALKRGRPLVGKEYQPCPGCGSNKGFKWVQKHGWLCYACKRIFHTIELYPASLKLELSAKIVAAAGVTTAPTKTEIAALQWQKQKDLVALIEQASKEQPGAIEELMVRMKEPATAKQVFAYLKKSGAGLSVAKQISQALDDALFAQQQFKPLVYSFGGAGSFDPWPMTSGPDLPEHIPFTLPELPEEPPPDPLPESMAVTAPYKRRIKL